MPKPDTKQQPVVTVRIVWAPATPAQRASWAKFWQRLIAEVKSEAVK